MHFLFIFLLFCSVIHSQLGAKQSFSSSQLEERRGLGLGREAERQSSRGWVVILQLFARCGHNSQRTWVLSPPLRCPPLPAYTPLRRPGCRQLSVFLSRFQCLNFDTHFAWDSQSRRLSVIIACQTKICSMFAPLGRRPGRAGPGQGRPCQSKFSVKVFHGFWKVFRHLRLKLVG